MNILDISQTIVSGYFNMMMIVDTNMAKKEFGAISGELEALGGAKLFLDSRPGRHKFFCRSCNLVINLLYQCFQIAVNTVKQTDSERMLYLS